MVDFLFIYLFCKLLNMYQIPYATCFYGHVGIAIDYDLFIFTFICICYILYNNVI